MLESTKSGFPKNGYLQIRESEQNASRTVKVFTDVELLRLDTAQLFALARSQKTNLRTEKRPAEKRKQRSTIRLEFRALRNPDRH